VQDAGHVGVLAAEGRLDDRQRTPVQLGGVIEAARVLERDGQRVQYPGDLEIVVAESVLGDRERLPEHAYGVCVTAVDAVHVAPSRSRAPTSSRSACSPASSPCAALTASAKQRSA
jgi:hypothetical protein